MHDQAHRPIRVMPNKKKQPSLISWLAAPEIPDAERLNACRLLNAILLVMIAGTLLGYGAAIHHPTPLLVVGGISAMLLLEWVSFYLLHTRREKLAAFILSLGLWLVMVGLGAISVGIANSAMYGFVLVVVIASLTLGRKTGLGFAALSGIASLAILISKQNGLLPEARIPFEPLSFWALSSVILLATAGMIQFAAQGLKEATRHAREGEQAQAKANEALNAIRATLEEQVRARTQELQNRSKYLQATIEVSRAASSILDSGQLMGEIVDMIQSRFELYYVGLFLLDPNQEWAILRAGTGLAGQAMIERGHRIRIGAGMIGWSIANAQPRIAAEIGRDTIRLATPELPETRSEAAFPLRTRGKVIGAMTIQSIKPQAFGETEIATFQTLADQIAVALENARLFSESQQALQEAQMATRQMTAQAWQSLQSRNLDLNFRYEHGRILSVSRDEVQHSESASDEILDLPIRVRDQCVGSIRFKKEAHEEDWSEDEIAMLRAVVDQLGVAVDSARLYDESQRRAERERMTGEIVAKMRATNDPQNILQTAVSELRKALQADRVQLLVKPPSSGGENSNDR